MRLVAVLMLAGCGRLGFGEGPSRDAPEVVDTATPTDVPGSDTLFYLPFEDDPADGVLDDVSGHGYSALCIAGLSCPTQVAGKRGNGVQFNGTDQYALIAHQPALSATQLTVALWVYLDVQVDQVAVGKPVGAGSHDSWGLVAWSVANMMTCFETTTGGADDWSCAPSVLPVSTWFHLAGVWDGAMKHLYINGVRAVSIPGPQIDFDASDIVVGGDQNNGALAYPWHGRLDELRVYDRALSQSDLTTLAAP